ncbi:uncharacterized protein LOC114342622 [Diabrotica virgifera virgifera]|uniref:THAP-type domain-containing protein n=1 Tax=Diabrotica virgifera virgifera TaxID=50390 RepID=A0ABM5JHU8_DIAVI|nr:uncharacterized protein LOC114342622 [Diabrotica virgifera virgifera]
MCEKHFQPHFISKGGNVRKNLFIQAHPTIFPYNQDVQSADEPLRKIIRLETQIEDKTEIDIMQPVANKTDASHSMHSIPDTLMEESLVTDVDVNTEVSTRPHTPAHTVSTQTPPKLSSSSPRKVKLRIKIKTLQKNIRKCKSPKKKKENDNIYLNKFNQMCDKLLNKPLAQIVKAQALLKSKPPKSRRCSYYHLFIIIFIFLVVFCKCGVSKKVNKLEH